MSARVFVDTNIFVYAHDSTEPVKQPIAVGWLQTLWQEERGRTSTQVLNECYFTLTQKLEPGLPADDAWEIVRALFAWKPQAIETDLLVRGRELQQRYRLSWWDSLIVAAAQAQSCVLLLSEDLQDRAVFGGVTVRNPFTLSVAEAAAEYQAPPPLPSRHRARGRPRRAPSAVA